MTVEMKVEMKVETEEARALLHTLWSRAVDTPGYAKSDWCKLESILTRSSNESAAVQFDTVRVAQLRQEVIGAQNRLSQQINDIFDGISVVDPRWEARLLDLWNDLQVASAALAKVEKFMFLTGTNV